jgi:hypothetical protein
MRKIATLWLAAVPLLIGACQNNQAGNNLAAANNVASAAPANTVAPTNTAAPVPQSGLELRLAGSGLTAGQPGLHPSTVHAFGMPRAEIVAAVAAIRGPATGEESNDECGAGPMQFTNFGPLTLHFQEGRWVGWHLSGPPASPPLKTDWDLGIGSPRAELDDGDNDQAQVSQTSLGTEFSVSDVHGLLSGNGANARVTHLWAGTDCAFR